MFLFFACFWSLVSFAQSVTIDPKANTTPIFEIKSTTEGMVMPKMTVAQRNAITGLTAGTQVYCTNCSPYGPYSYDGGSWVAMFQTTTVSPITYTVGQAAQGGIVFWIDPASGGQHGLVAATSDVSSLYGWGLSTTGFVCVPSKGMYAGYENTTFISQAFKEYLWVGARNCKAYNGGGYGDWYLPSIDELAALYTTRNLIGGFVNANYWSSTENANASCCAFKIDFSTGNIIDSYKESYYRIRPIRRF